MESKHENDRLDDELMELFSAPVPSSFEEKWRSAIQREESLTMSQFDGNREQKQKKAARMGRKWWKAAVPAAAALVLVAGSCWVGAQQPEYGASDRSFSAQPRLYTSASDYDGGYQNEAAAYDLVGSSDESGYAKKSVSMASGSSADTSALEPTAETSRKLIRTASLTIRTAQYDADLEALTQLISSVGGYIESTYQSGDLESGSARSNSMTLRIPSDKLDEFLNGLDSVGRVVDRSESSTDMTVQYADNEARLATLRAKMERLNELLEKAETVEDLISIESAIADTQYSIDSYETRQRTIDRQVDMSEVDIYLREDSPVEVTSEMSLGERISRAFQNSVEDFGQFLRNMLVFIVMALPALGLMAIITAAVLLICRAREKREKGKGDERAKMKRMAMLILALMLTVLPVAALGEGESTVTVYGYGKTYVTLDTAVITFEISASAKTVQEARKQHDQKLEELYTTLESVGISKDQLQMSDSFLNTQYEFKFGKLERGVEQDEQSVGSEWKLTLPEKGMLEGTLDAILSANVVSGYTFTLESSGKQEAYQEALDLAMDYALQKAEFVAKTNGMKLGALRSLKEEEPVFGHTIRSETDELMDSTIVSATVEMVWELVK